MKQQIATYFLKALYQLHASQQDKYMFTRQEIITKMQDLLPEIKSQIPDEFSNLFIQEEANPLSLNFCMKIIADNDECFMANFDISSGAKGEISSLLSIDSSARSYLDQYYPEATKDYLIAFDAFLNQSLNGQGQFDVVTEKNHSLDKTNDDPNDLIPNFKATVARTSNTMLVQAQEIVNSVFAQYNGKIELKLTTIEKVFQAICENIVIAKENIYGYMDICKNIFNQTRLQEGQKIDLIYEIEFCNQELIRLGYCSTYTDHLLSSVEKVMPAKFFMRLDKEFARENFKNAEELNSLYTATLSAIKTFGASNEANGNTKDVLELQFYDFQTIKAKAAQYLNLDHKERNRVILNALLKLLSTGHQYKFKSIDILNAIDKSFECIKELPFFKSYYPLLVQKLMMCPYLVYKQDIDTFYKVNLHKKFANEDFPESSDVRKIYDEVIAAYQKLKINYSLLNKILHAFYSYCLREQKIYIKKNDLPNILTNYFGEEKLDTLVTIGEFLSNRGVWFGNEELYCFLFNDKVHNFLLAFDPGLIHYYKQLHALQVKILKHLKTLKVETPNIEHNQQQPSIATQILQFGHPASNGERKRKCDLQVEDAEPPKQANIMQQ